MLESLLPFLIDDLSEDGVLSPASRSVRYLYKKEKSMVKIQNSRQNAGKCSPPGCQDCLLRVGEGGHDVVELVLERGEGGVEAAHRGLGCNSIQ